MEYTELILDMLNRIVKLEKEVEALKKEKESFAAPPTPQKSEFVCSLAPAAAKDSGALPTAEERPTHRDKTRYMFNGNVCLKNKLVLAVVKDYVAKNPGITCRELKEVFDKSLQGSMGVVEHDFIARQRSNYHVRFFAGDDEVLHLSDGVMLVCSQWGILNISNFIRRAEQLGYQIEQINRD